MTNSQVNSTSEVMVRAQDTPNPFAIKFITNFPLKSVGNATFTSADDGRGLPMVETLFAVPGVEQVYFFQNTATITHTEELPVQMIKDQVSAILKSRAPIHNPDFDSPEEKVKVAKPDRLSMSPERIEIEEILDRTIRPGLQSDGGDVEVVEFSNNVVKIIYQGACGGCPSSMMGTLDAIQSILQNELKNPDITVEPL